MRFAAELWDEPTPTTLITGNGSVSSIISSHDVRLAYGWRVADDIFNGDGFYVGPEAQYLGTLNYRRAIKVALEAGFTGPLCVEHYGGDGLSVSAMNALYLRRILAVATGEARTAMLNRTGAEVTR